MIHIAGFNTEYSFPICSKFILLSVLLITVALTHTYSCFLFSQKANFSHGRHHDDSNEKDGNDLSNNLKVSLMTYDGKLVFRFDIPILMGEYSRSRGMYIREYVRMRSGPLFRQPFVQHTQHTTSSHHQPSPFYFFSSYAG